MVATLDDIQRKAIATKLADMRVMQNLMISNEQKLMEACSSDKQITDRLTEMLKDDRGSLSTIEQVIAKFGMPSQPHEKVQNYAGTVESTMAGTELALYEKALQHEVMKHQLVMLGLLVHKAAQVVGEEVRETIEPLYKVNFKNRTHQEQLKGIIYFLGTRELVGKEPDTSVWAAVQDGVAAVKGIFGGITE